MTRGHVAGLILFLAGLSVGWVANLLYFRMIADVNRKLPDEQQMSYLWMYPGRLLPVFRMHKRLYPDSRLRLASWVVCGLAVALTLAAFSLL